MASKYIYDWLIKQPNVKEESLTDWLLFDISKNINYIHYKEFNRREETRTGADWEWWVLIRDNYNNRVAYRFLIQAKKLNIAADNYDKLNYKNGTQIQTLLDYAFGNNALPLYVYYTTTQPDYFEQIKNFTKNIKPFIDWCRPCINGAFLSLAITANKLLKNTTRGRLVDSCLVNHSLGLSVLDTHSRNESLMYLEGLNTSYKNLQFSDYQLDSEYINGIRHSAQAIPSYVYAILENQVLNEENSEIYSDSQLFSKISGVGVVNLI